MMNSYQLLASQRLSRVLAISSGVIDEAAYFQTLATRCFMPKRRASGFHYSIPANLSLLERHVMEAVLACVRRRRSRSANSIYGHSLR